LHSIVKKINYEESMASRYEDSRFNMGKLKRTKVFLDTEANVDDEESFDDA
jgi:hypothetical protein